MTLDEIIKNCYDLHLHIGSEILPRKYRTDNLVKELSGKISGCVLKNHFYPTAPLIPSDCADLDIFGSVVLNRFCGGPNPDAIYASALIAPKPLFVWLPTIHSAQFLKESKFEIPPEWTGNPNFQSRLSSAILPVEITKASIQPVIKAVKDVGGVLCTGHISWQESVMVAEESLKNGLSKIIITHPIYQRIDMPVDIQKELASVGCFIEQCYSMITIDNIPAAKIAEQILEVGSEKIVLSSDVGQLHSTAADSAMRNFAQILMNEGIGIEKIKMMMVDNPKKIIA